MQRFPIEPESAVAMPDFDQNWKGCPTIICTPVCSRERAKSIRPTRPLAWNRTPSPASHLRAQDHCPAGW